VLETSWENSPLKHDIRDFPGGLLKQQLIEISRRHDLPSLDRRRLLKQEIKGTLEARQITLDKAVELIRLKLDAVGKREKAALDLELERELVRLQSEHLDFMDEIGIDVGGREGALVTRIMEQHQKQVKAITEKEWDAENKEIAIITVDKIRARLLEQVSGRTATLVERQHGELPD